MTALPPGSLFAQRTAKYHASGGLEREISSRRKHADLKKKIDQREHRKKAKSGGKRERPAWEAADEEAEVMGQAAIARSKCGAPCSARR